MCETHPHRMRRPGHDQEERGFPVTNSLDERSHTVRTDTGPFAIVPLWLLDAINAHKPGGMGSALAVYVALHRWADYDTGECWPSHKRIGDAAGISASTVKAALRLLRDIGAVSWVSTTTDDGDPGPNLYTVRHARPTSGGSSPEGWGEQSPEGWGEQSATNKTHVNEIQMNENARAVELCELFADAIERDTGKRPTITKRWATDMDRLIRLDDRNPDEIERVILWLSRSRHEVAAFWWPNVRSPKKLRERWDQIAAQVRRERMRTAPGSGGSMVDRIRQSTGGPL